MRTIKYPFAIPKPLYPDFFPYVFNREEISLWAGMDLYRQTNDVTTLRRQKSSDTLSILASGSSINELDESDFDFIDSTDSMALNWWGVYHDFVPDFYKFEFVGEPELDTKWINNINKKSTEYEETTLIYDPEPIYNEDECISDYLRRLDSSFWENFVDIRISQYFVGSDVDFCPELLEYLFPTPLGNRFLHYRGSLSQALAMGEFMGYDDIILFGVDLDNSEYFWGEHPVWEFRERPDSDDEHVTAADDVFNGIDDYIRTLHSEILPGRGTELYIGSRQSELYPDLPYFREHFL